MITLHCRAVERDAEQWYTRKEGSWGADVWILERVRNGSLDVLGIAQPRLELSRKRHTSRMAPLNGITAEA